MEKLEEWIIGGDINAEMVGEVAVILKKQGIKMNLVPGDLSKEAYLISTPEVLITAAAIASVLSFMLSLVQAIKKNQRSNTSLPPDNDKAVLERQLVEFRADGFEVETLSINDKEVSITMNDIPGRQTIIMEKIGDCEITIRRQRSEYHQ